MGVYIASRGALVARRAADERRSGRRQHAGRDHRAEGGRRAAFRALEAGGPRPRLEGSHGDLHGEDWAYERELATSLLKDTRLYRLAAEERGLTSLAGVMRDLELVLLETSMAEQTDQKALGQIQRIIEKRGLIEKMDAVPTVGM